MAAAVYALFLNGYKDFEGGLPLEKLWLNHLFRVMGSFELLQTYFELLVFDDIPVGPLGRLQGLAPLVVVALVVGPGAVGGWRVDLEAHGLDASVDAHDGATDDVGH